MANEKAVIRFRCYQCGKLLGTASARAGKTTTCPNCKAELIVPEPDDPEKAALAEATRSLVPNLDDPGPLRDRPREPAPAPSVGHDPSFSWEELDTAIFQAPGGPAPIDLLPSAPADEPGPSTEPETVESAPPEPAAPAVAPPLIPVPSAVAVPSIDVGLSPIQDGRTRRRRAGEVVLTQAVISSWAAFMLLALGISFVAGLFVGHFLWKGP
jgi:hypothetical protein